MSDTHRPKIDGSTEADLLIAVEPERNTIGIIRSLIVTNNTTMSDQELAAWIYETYRKRTENHIERVKRCATWYRQYFLDHFENGQAVYEKFMRQVEQHDADKFYGPENVAYYAANTILFNPKWHDFYEISQETMNKFEQDYWPKHYVNNPHHPEYWAVTKTDDKTGEQYCRCDRDSLEAAFHDRETQAIVLVEMVSDWSAMGCELGDSASAWFEKTNGKRFIWEDDIIDWFLRPMLELERAGDTEVNNSLPHGLEKDFTTPQLKGVSDEVLKAAVITPVVTTVVVSPTEVYTIHRGETIETKNGCRIMVDNDGNPHALEGSEEKLMSFLHASSFGTITNRAKAYYNPVGSNSWQHIQQVLTQAIKFVRTIDHREITPVEYATVLFHDCSVKSDPAKIHHASKSAEIAKRVLKDLFTEIELDEIYVAIKAHDKEDNPDWTFTSSTADLLASADANPPDPDWILNKSWSWGISHGLSPEERITNMMSHSVPFYGSTPEEGGMKWPDHYAKYYKDDIANLRKIFKSLTPETCLERVMAYRKLHKLSENDIRLPEPSCEVFVPSTEALPAGFKEKRKKIEAYILSSMKLLDPHTDVNQKYWKNKFASMSDADFDKFMHYIQEKKCNIHMFVPPLKVTLKNAELVEAAHKLGVKLMHRIWMTDPNTGMRYLTPEEYMVVQLPVRRQQQYLDEKISVPDNDKTIDGLTGQVTGDSKACAITNPEIQIMQARNLDASLYEYVNVRGGNINNYAEFKRSLEETGAVSLNSLDPNNRTRVSVMGGVLLTAMMIENNLAEV